MRHFSHHMTALCTSLFLCSATSDAAQPNNVGSYAEWDQARKVLMHTPGNEVFMGLIHPAAGLYECPFDPVAAKKEHENYIQLLKKNGVEVYTLRDMMRAGTLDEQGNAKKGKALEDLQKFAASILEYRADLSDKTFTQAQSQYKWETLTHLHPDTLIDIIFSHPTVSLERTHYNTGVVAHYSEQPLMGAYFLRDQSITTCKGVIMANMNSPQRAAEVDVVRFAYEKMGIAPVYAIEAPGKLEGGDFLPAGMIDFIGVGLRTNEEAVQQLFNQRLFCGERVAVVKDSWKNQEQMHLDTYFNIVAPGKVVLVETRINPKDPKFALKVDIYQKNKKGSYDLQRADQDFVAFLKEENYNIIPISTEDQLKYGVNFLTIAPNRALGIDGVSDSYKQALAKAGVEVEWMSFKNLTCGYGAAHCSTQVFSRIPGAAQP